MSIITDALKKAEHERELREKRVLEETARGVHEEGAVKPEEFVSLSPASAMSEFPSKMVWSEGVGRSARKQSPFSSWQPRQVFLWIGILLGLLFVLLLLTRWPSTGKNFSIAWRMADRGAFFQAHPFGGRLGPGAPVSPLPTRGAEDHSFVKLPFSLSGISVSGADRFAIVNGQIVREGDAIDGALVKQILDREVIIETRNGEIKLKIPS